MERPREFWVRATLVVLALANLLNYLDRYLVHSVKPHLLEEWQLSEAGSGYLISAFVIGYAIFSPIMGVLSVRFSLIPMMAGGVLLWSLMTIATGFCTTPNLFVMARIGVGVGEAAFATVAPAFLKSLVADPIKLNRALSWFYAAIPVGSALGFVVGGIAAEHASWQSAFFVGGVPGIFVFVGILAVSSLASSRGTRSGKIEVSVDNGDDDPTRRKSSNFNSSARALLRIPRFWAIAFGYICQTFALTGIAASVAKHGMNLGFSLSEIDTAFGLILVVTGLVGSVGGGYLASMFAAKSNSAMRSLLFFIGATTLAGVPILTLALLVENRMLFLFLCFLSELVIFSSTAPLNSAIILAVPSNLVPLAQGACIALINVFGAFLAPIVVGAVADLTSLRLGMLICPVALLVGGLIWFRVWMGMTAEN